MGRRLKKLVTVFSTTSCRLVRVGTERASTLDLGSFNRLVRVSTLATAALFSAVVPTHAAMNQVFTTELQAVRTSSVNGRELLTIHINMPVGPANCQGNVLRVDSAKATNERQQEIEFLALEAMLTSEPVVLTVPTAMADCIDGMPTIIDINLASAL